MLELNLTKEEKDLYEKLCKKWNFKSNEYMIKFLMDVMGRCDTNRLLIEKDEGLGEFDIYEMEVYAPNKSILID